jgi:hypothetical protein
MKTQTAGSFQRSETRWRADYRVISGMKPKTVAYRLTQTTTVTTQKPRAAEHVEEKEHVTEGITRHSVLMAHLRGARVGVAPVFRHREKEGMRGGILCMATPELLEFLRTRGNGWLKSEEMAYYREHGKLGPPRPEVEAKPLTALEGGASEDLIVFYEWGNHRVLTRGKKELPWARTFEYVSAYIDNGHYDLPKLVEVLEARDDVILFSRRHGDGVIVDIEHYNASAARNRTVTFLWQPSVADCRAVVVECERIGGSYPTTNWREAVFNLDLLGLRKGGAAKYEEFYGCDAEPEDTDDNDSYGGGW